MLKALELSGFKSFADKTRFEFPSGVTMVVGPNGSGKSNVVDAIRWVLGSQSAKSLRGKEMTDVIFNGSGSRGPLNAAEVTLTLHNRDALFDIEAPEVHITRRVYRSGEGEYLVNRQPCRLRDIRDLLSGTGIATEAYSIIEQGKVDVLLQSSPRDRRIIFEEAAGIRRFKTKKVESARRLERVSQNLLRLSDMVEEVGSRLRNVRSQAGKARRYRECANRLRELRTQVGLVDWRALSERLNDLDNQLTQVRQQHAECQHTLDESEAQADTQERELEVLATQQRQQEEVAAQTREQIAADRAAIANGRLRCGDLEQEITTLGRQVVAMSTQTGGAVEQVRHAEHAIHHAELEFDQAAAALRDGQTQLAAALDSAEKTRVAIENDRAAHASAIHKATSLAAQLELVKSRQATAHDARQEAEARLQQLEEEHATWATERSTCAHREQQLAAELDAAATLLRGNEAKFANGRHDLAATQKKLRTLESESTRLAERIAVLDELEQRREGYSQGVIDVLTEANQSPTGPFRDICGVVADLFRVDVDTAPLIEVALGDHAQHVVIASGDQLLDYLQEHPLSPPGRVAFLRLDARVAANAVDRIDLATEAGVLGRADAFVETAPQFDALVRRLLGRTWLVDSLSTAVRLSHSIGRGLSFVTSEGQLLTADGTVVLGPRLGSTGLLTRSSELRACRDRIADLEQQISSGQQFVQRLESEISQREDALATSRERHTQLTHDLAASRRELSGLEDRGRQLQRQQQQLTLEIRSAGEEAQAAAHSLQTASEELTAARQLAQRLEVSLDEASAQLATLNQLVRQRQSAATEARVTAAKSEQRLETLRSQLAQVQHDRQEREATLVAVQNRQQSRQEQLSSAELQILAATQDIAHRATEKEKLAHDMRRLTAVANEIRIRRPKLQQQVRRARKKIAELQAREQELELRSGKLRLELESLCDRLREDYGIELANVAHSGTDGDPATDFALENREEVENEIRQLRERLSGIGAVNLDALDELDSLEERFTRISTQHQDLVDAKASLERIIQRINVDSRQLFLETLEVIRGHFQELFRRLFGGGDADIVLEDTDGDVLEAGIDIVACPPGKDTRKISLLSGGERTLTCVALLLAVFRSRPSPFCVLDEVDAALDESNIGRFVTVLREFLAATQFIVVTHSKRTMFGADTIYGVTMQESGISKQVSVRFEDVTEDGQVRPGGVNGRGRSEGQADPEGGVASDDQVASGRQVDPENDDSGRRRAA